MWTRQCRGWLVGDVRLGVPHKCIFFLRQQLLGFALKLLVVMGLSCEVFWDVGLGCCLCLAEWCSGRCPGCCELMPTHAHF